MAEGRQSGGFQSFNVEAGIAGAGTAGGVTGQDEPPKTGSFLNAAGNKPATKHQAVSATAELALFAFFVLTRAIHPSIIDASKTLDPVTGKKVYGYASGTTVIMMTLFVVVYFQIQILFRGVAEWQKIWVRKEIMTFSMNGIIYAIGDWLELLSLGSLSGAPYQVLLQTKFIFTALMMLYLKGTQQSNLQWILLVALMMSIAVYMSISSSGETNTPIDGMTFALLKVLVSCLGAVVSDKYMKEYKNTPVDIQLVQMGIARCIGSFLLSFIGTTIWDDGFFHGWNVVVVFVMFSFFVKSVSTLYLVKLLDSMLKNIGEALAIIVIYAWAVVDMRVLGWTRPITDEPFNFTALMGVILIVLLVGAFLLSKSVVDKSKKWDKLQAQDKAIGA